MTKKGQETQKLHLKSGVKRVIRILLLLFACFLFYRYMNNLPIKNIIITGNNEVLDKEIIKLADIQDYPLIYRLNKNKVIKNIKTNPLIKDVDIKRNILGKITINITERKLLFYYKFNNKYIANDNTFINNISSYGLPILINFTPDTIFDSLVKGLNKIDRDIIRMINTIEYTPYKTIDGVIIDETRFTLKMNDGNTIIIDTVNIKKLNDYFKIYASLSLDGTKGTLYLDTITEENIYFKKYE